MWERPPGGAMIFWAVRCAMWSSACEPAGGRGGGRAGGQADPPATPQGPRLQTLRSPTAWRLPRAGAPPPRPQTSRLVRPGVPVARAHRSRPAVWEACAEGHRPGQPRRPSSGQANPSVPPPGLPLHGPGMREGWPQPSGRGWIPEAGRDWTSGAGLAPSRAGRAGFLPRESLAQRLPANPHPTAQTLEAEARAGGYR